MSKVTLTFGSFVLGVLVGSLFLGSHTVTMAHSSPLSQMTDLTLMNVPDDGTAIEAGKEPIIPGMAPKNVRLTILNSAQVLDGLNCENCKFENVLLKYGGGAYTLTGATFTGTLRAQLFGAAANTANFMALLQAIVSGKPAEVPVNPNRPVLKSASTKNPITLDFTSPYTPTK